MDTSITLTVGDRKLYKIAFALAIFTIVYNLAEGIIATWFGLEDETLALFGFGADSFIEMISGIGIAHMVWRIFQHPTSHRDAFERTALKITGYSFYLLTLGLVISACIVIYTNQKPTTTFWGIVISLLSILVMLFLIYEKTKIGKRLNSEPILADANCTRVCIYMSVILLISSVVYELTHVPYIDAIGTFGLAIFSFREGRECFEKAASDKHCVC